MRVETYQDAAGLWRWRLRARNGKIVADGAEGYSSRRNLKRALKSLADYGLPALFAIGALRIGLDR